MDDDMFLELIYNMLPYQDEIMDEPTTDDNTSVDEEEGTTLSTKSFGRKNFRTFLGPNIFPSENFGF